MPLHPPPPVDPDPDILATAARRLAPVGATSFLVAAAAPRAPVGAMSSLVADAAVTYAVDGASITAEEGRADGENAVRLSPAAWDDMVRQMRTFITLLLSDELHFERGGFEQLADW